MRDRDYKGGRGYSKYLYRNAKREWIYELADAYNEWIRLDQTEIICRLKLSWPAWRSIINGGDMKLSTFMKICEHFHIPVDEAILREQEFQRDKV